MKKLTSIFIAAAFLITTIFDSGRLALAITVGSGSTSSGNIAGQLGQIAESAGPVQSFQADLFTGRAQTSVPIFVPPGRKNVQPNVSLNYSSSSGNSWLGLGWNLDMGYIQRDLKKGVPKFDSTDKYVFSFQGVSSELVLVATNEYRAKDEALFLKFVFDPTGAGNKWTVTDKSGTKHYFGETSASRQLSGSNTFKWALSTVEDTSGNYMSVSYTTDSGELYLSQIDYSGNTIQSFAHSHKVEFTLEDRADGSISHITGARVETKKRLKEIQMKVKDASGVYQLARKYTLAYNTSPSSLKSRLAQVTECGKDGITCLPPVTFTYQDKPLEFESFQNLSGVQNDTNVGVKGSFIRNSRADGSSWTNTWADTLDLNGDGLPDRIQKMAADGKWKFYENQGVSVGFDEGVEVTGLTSSDSSAQGYYSRAVADSGSTEVDMVDLNGDGLPDRVMSLGSTLTSWYWQKNQGGSFAASQAITGIISADTTAGQYRISHTTPSSPQTTTSDFVDLNGDGVLDRLMKISTDTDKYKIQSGSMDASNLPIFAGALVDVTGVAIPSGAPAGANNIRYYGTSSGGYSVADSELMDLNGDGLPDRVMPHPSDTSKWKVQFGNGTSFQALEDWGPIENLGMGNGADYHKMRSISSGGVTHVDLVDINSDGLPDRVVYNNTTSWYVQINKGNGFNTSQLLSGIENPTGNPNYYYMRMAESGTGDQGMDLLDIDGDGLIDRVISESGASSWMVQRGKGPYPDLLKEINNGRGGKTAITYSSSTTFDNKDTNGKERLPFAVQVVTQVNQSDGMGNTYTTSYSYKGGMFSAAVPAGGEGASREFRGFREVTVTDAAGTKTIHTFGQDDHNKGKLLTKEVRDSAGNLFSKEVTTWSDTHPWGTGVDVHFVFVSQQDNYIYDGDASYKQTRQTFTYDGYGNLASTTEEGDTSISTDSRMTVNTYVYGMTAPGSGSGTYIVNTLSKTTLYDTDLTTIKAERYFYYDGAASITTAPVKGLLTKEEEWLSTASGCGAPGVCTNNPKTQMTYDSYGNVATVVDARSYTTTNTYDSTYHLFLVTISNALSQSRSFTYDPWIAQILTSTDQNSQVTETQYDALGRVSKVIAPLDSSSEPTQEFVYEYPSAGCTTCTTKVTTKVKSSVPGQTFTQLITYSFTDGLGREIQRRSPAESGSQQIVSGIVEFDARGLVSKQYVPYFENTSTSYQALVTSGPKATFTYDAVGRRTRIDYPDGTNSQVAFSDFVKTTTDQRAKQLRYTNDAYGRLMKVEEFNSGATYTTTYEYDVLNNLKKTTDNATNQTTITYDSLSRKTAMADPDMGSWSYAYDLNDNLTSQTDAKSQVVSFTYDALNRVTLKDLPVGETDVIYGYDDGTGAWLPGGVPGSGFRKGRLAKVTDASGTHEFVYDAQGRVTHDRKTVDGVSYTFIRTYDAMGRVRTLTYPDTEVVTYTYNNFGDVESISYFLSPNSSGYYIKDVNYNSSGQITFTKYGNNVTSDYTYNSNTLRLSNILTKKPDGVTKLQDLSYTFDGNGNVTAIADVVNSMSQSFTYDDLNRLTQAIGSAYGTQNFAYDSIGNMTTKANFMMSYGSGGSKPHAVTSVSWSSGNGPSFCASSPCTMMYDASGNMTGRSNDTLTYDSENRLKQITAYEGTTSTQNYTLKPGWNVISFPYLPENRSISSLLSPLVFGTDYDQVSTWCPATGAWCHFVNDSDFNDFTAFEYGKTYEIYNKSGVDKSFSVTGKSPGPEINHQIKVGDNLISPAVKTATNVSTVLSGLTLGTHYSDVKRFNATTQVWESYASSQFTQFEPGKGYNIIGLQNSSFNYGNTQQTTTFVYDSTGSRVKKTVGATTTIYLGKDYDVTGPITTKYIFLGDRRISMKDSSGTLLFYHTDHINSSNVITDFSGNQAALLEYSPYGETVTHTGSANPKHKFTGQESDDSTRLYYYGARYMDPQLGRFITADTMVQAPSDPQSFNRYADARNNPIIFTDPTGNFWFVAAIIGAIVGAVSAGIQSGGDFKSILVGAGIGFLSGAAGGTVGGHIGGWVGAIVGGAVGGAIAGGLNAAVYGGDIGQGILRGAGFGAAGGFIFGGIDAGINQFTQGMKTTSWRWEMAHVALDGAAGGGLSQLSGGEFWEGVAFSSAISGSRFMYRVALELSGQPARDPSLRTSDGSAKEKLSDQITHGFGSATSDVGSAVYKDEHLGFLKKYLTGETSALMRGLSRFMPGLDPLAEMHDPAMSAVKSRTGPGLMFETINKGTIVPAYGITVLGALHEPAQMATFVAYGEEKK